MSIANDIGSSSGTSGSGTPQTTGTSSMPQGREMSRGATDAGGGVRQSLKDVGAMAADKATHLKDSAQEYLHAGKDKAQEYLEAGKDKAQEYYDMSKAKAQEWENTVEQFIREKPLQSVLMAAGVGALIGFFLRR